ncbi:MAG: leucine-rich repeat domain-containing protein [Candidatus Faecousia sp.]|nr:leucine-rich repeat domain-containing protein [Bacillota bacterium]MDY4220593.1 leucine-rich repeat domain-containing protein [Candidatus Faecousia sp.]
MKKKWIPALLVLTFVLLLTACGKKETPAENFRYKRENGEITITGYTGADRGIVIPKEIDGRPVTKIGEQAFEGYDLTSVSFPETVTHIEMYAFRDCECLERVELPDSLLELGAWAFDECDALKELRIPKNAALEESGLYGISWPVEPETVVHIAEGSRAWEQIQERSISKANGEPQYVFD